MKIILGDWILDKLMLNYLTIQILAVLFVGQDDYTLISFKNSIIDSEKLAIGENYKDDFENKNQFHYFVADISYLWIIILN